MSYFFYRSDDENQNDLENEDNFKIIITENQFANIKFVGLTQWIDEIH